MVDHGSREHAQWSASATERNWNCAGALALTDGLPEKTSEAADWGTCAHQIAEKCLRGQGPADRYVGTTEKGKVHSIEVDEEMVETVEVYTNYVVGRIEAEEGTTLRIEQHFTLNSLKPPFDAGGTADAVIYFPQQKLLEVVDLKGGRGVVVDAIGNPQLRTYALGAMLANQGLDVTHVRVTIVQPRAPHKDGRIRSETFHIADLVEWTADLLAAMKRSYIAIREKQDEVGATMSFAQWAAAHLSAGDHCKFCKAKATCPAVEKAAYDAAGIWFDDLDQPRLANDAEPNDPVKLSRDLDALDMIEGWIAAVRERAHSLAEQGVDIPNYVLVPKQAREKWNEGAEEQVIGAAVLAQLPEDKYLNPAKLKTPKQVRKELGSKAKLIDGLSSTPDAGTNLVRADKTTRSAVPGTAARFFAPIE